MAADTDSTPDFRLLRALLVDRFSDGELRDLCFDLDADYEGLPGEGKADKARELVTYCKRRGRLAELAETMRRSRPDIVLGGESAEQQKPLETRVATSPAHLLQAVSLPDVLTIDTPMHLELVRVPAGEFLMGSDRKRDRQAYDEEQPQYRLSLPDFYAGKYPVTVAQFRAFVQATGHKTTAEQQQSGGVYVYANRTWTWVPVQGADWQHPAGPESNLEGKDPHPVTQVSWHDARAFCRWLSRITGRAFRLPTEAEWEKAARGDDGRLYPWGNWAPDANVCNFHMNVGDTSPVGSYVDGASPYNALDMAGNVWEWTSSLWGEDGEKPDFEYPYDANDGREDPSAPDTVRRVLRGGAFYIDARNVRCACRSRRYPDQRLNHVGFRVVASPSIHDSGR